LFAQHTVDRFATPKELKFFHRTTEYSEYYLYLSNNDKYIKTSQMKETFGEYIKRLRNENGLTLTQLAARLDLDSANLSKIENGKRDFDEKRLGQLSMALNLDLNLLKTEFYGNLFAKKLYENQCSNDVLIVAEKKVEYLRSTNVKQANLDL
jgi:transcriptional regulator with XRE-family HTH domain